MSHPPASAAVNAPTRPILVLSTSPVLARPGGTVLIDRKFHVGMLEYERRLRHPLACLVPRMAAGAEAAAMDHVEIARAALPYAVELVESPALTNGDVEVMRRTIHGAALVYLGGSERFNLVAASLAVSAEVPYVVITEYTLRTELDIMRATTRSLLRRFRRELRLRVMHRRKLRMIAGAAEVHANGFPTYEEMARVNPRRLLFLDTRALRSDVLPADALQRRLATAGSHPPRLVFSGRYHPMKGAADVVRVGLELRRSGRAFTLDLYGTGPLKADMLRMIDAAGARDSIRVHDAIPYKPDLVEFTRSCDLFLACHVQGDPSCTYVETFACGVPIVGYSNEMWAPLCAASGGGLAVPVGDVRAMASAVGELLDRPDRLGDLAVRARDFAADHTMEDAWDARAARLEDLALP